MAIFLFYCWVTVMIFLGYGNLSILLLGYSYDFCSYCWIMAIILFFCWVTVMIFSYCWIMAILSDVIYMYFRFRPDLLDFSSLNPADVERWVVATE